MDFRKLEEDVKSMRNQLKLMTLKFRDMDPCKGSYRKLIREVVLELLMENHTWQMKMVPTNLNILSGENDEDYSRQIENIDTPMDDEVLIDNSTEGVRVEMKPEHDLTPSADEMQTPPNNSDGQQDSEDESSSDSEWLRVTAKKTKKYQQKYNPTPTFKAEVCQRSREIGVAAAAREFNVPSSSIGNWMKKLDAEFLRNQQEDPTQNTNVASPSKSEEKQRARRGYKTSMEFKFQVCKRSSEVGSTKAGREFDVPAKTVLHWMQDFPNLRQRRHDMLGRVYTSKHAKAKPKLSSESSKPTGESNISANCEMDLKHKTLRQSYTAGFKIKVCNRADEIGNSKAASEFGVPLRCVYNWKKELPLLAKLKKSRKSLRGGKAKRKELDRKLLEEVKDGP